MTGLAKVVSGVVLVLVAGIATIVLVAGTSSNPAHCVSASRALGLNAAANAKALTLPPSHDNDAGRARIPDATPDADNDAGQRPVLCNP